jgi:hypothetical protein
MSEISHRKSSSSDNGSLRSIYNSLRPQDKLRVAGQVSWEGTKLILKTIGSPFVGYSRSVSYSSSYSTFDSGYAACDGDPISRPEGAVAGAIAGALGGLAIAGIAYMRSNTGFVPLVEDIIPATTIIGTVAGLISPSLTVGVLGTPSEMITYISEAKINAQQNIYATLLRITNPKADSKIK